MGSLTTNPPACPAWAILRVRLNGGPGVMEAQKANKLSHRLRILDLLFELFNCQGGQPEGSPAVTNKNADDHKLNYVEKGELE